MWGVAIGYCLPSVVSQFVVPEVSIFDKTCIEIYRKTLFYNKHVRSVYFIFSLTVLYLEILQVIKTKLSMLATEC